MAGEEAGTGMGVDWGKSVGVDSFFLRAPS